MDKSYLRIWGDVVEPKALVFSILIISTTTMGAHLLAPEENGTLGLFFGIGGAMAGFFISALLFRPRRHIREEER